MICASCGQAMTGPVCTCGWIAPKIRPQQAQVKTVTVYSEPQITREEFGLTLYRVISLFSQRDQLRKDQASDVYRERRDRLAWYREQEKDLTQQIVALMPEIAPADQAWLMDRFEPVRKVG
jgi:hypothetical protein